MSKSHVSLEQKMCLVTGQPFDSGTLLLDKRLRNSLEKHTLTGWGYSPEVAEKFKEGYVALVGADHSKSKINKEGTTEPENAYRTGDVIYMKREAAERIINFPKGREMVFVDEGVVKYLTNLEKESRDED